MRRLLLSALLLSSAFQTALGEQSGDWTYDILNNQATITGYTGVGGAVTIPSEVNGIPVVRFGAGERVFSYMNTFVTSITIPNSVTSIGAAAFEYCFGLTSVTIGNSVTSIGVAAFSTCTSLTSVTIGNSVTSIGGYAFMFTSLNYVAIPNGVTSIGELAFYGCASLTSVTIGNSVTSIGNSAFSKCNLLTSINIPNSVTSIGGGAFYNCGNLTSIILGNSVTSIGNGAFANCNRLYTITIPNSVTSIGNGAFTGCLSLSIANIPRHLEPLFSSYGLAATQAYFTRSKAELNSLEANNFTNGQQNVLTNPNSYGLYTTSQIQNMAVGDLVLTKNVGGTFTLNYDIEQSTDLQSWLPYQSFNLPLTNLPPDKAFIRIKAKQ